jgi:hypothetical protein
MANTAIETCAHCNKKGHNKSEYRKLKKKKEDSSNNKNIRRQLQQKNMSIGVIFVTLMAIIPITAGGIRLTKNNPLPSSKKERASRTKEKASQIQKEKEKDLEKGGKQKAAEETATSLQHTPQTQLITPKNKRRKAGIALLKSKKQQVKHLIGRITILSS